MCVVGGGKPTLMCVHKHKSTSSGRHTHPAGRQPHPQGILKALHRLGGADSLFAGIRALGQGRTHPIVRNLLCALRAALLEKVDFADGSFLPTAPSA